MSEKQLDLETARQIVTERLADPPKPARRAKDDYPDRETVKQAIRELHEPAQSLLRQLAEPFPASMVEKAPEGKYGEYVSHPNVTQRALSIVGFYTFDVLEVIRGHASKVGERYPARDDAVVGVVCRLTIYPPEGPRSVTEVGAEDNPAMHNDGENLKNCVSDAVKRCWMRFGLGLHLWAGKGYWLDKQLDKHDPTVR